MAPHWCPFVTFVSSLPRSPHALRDASPLRPFVIFVSALHLSAAALRGAPCLLPFAVLLMMLPRQTKNPPISGSGGPLDNCRHCPTFLLKQYLRPVRLHGRVRDGNGCGPHGK